ncbi:erythromycin esterase family protein [Chryseobacterium oryzae]|uniref:Erythromycin esterase family protein n=1 Tax=Chryseobacterium oryzae TaxID=2929799 RepID=A0ABY4BDD8_9FLAO|nr:erythromycin esterase family protein [Chryseobacterium oryzae]UOE37158.1 erythromycin esterase family protein [Chryseobacterium oryzae]
MKNILLLICCTCFILIKTQVISQHPYILLGEPTHGDGAVFDEKVKIIKQLSKDHNFKTILFEAGFYDNFKAWELYKINGDINIYNSSIFKIWSETKAFQELISYIKQNPEIKILGIDCQEGQLFEQYYLEDLKNTLSKNKINISEDELQMIDKIIINKDLENLKNDEDEKSKYNSVCQKILSAFASLQNKDYKTKVIEQSFKSSKAEVDYTLRQLNKEFFAVQNPRDLQMAENFIFLQKELKNEKLILWAANYHIANNLKDFKLTDISVDYIKNFQTQEKQLTGHNEESLEDKINQINEIKESITLGKILKDYYKDQLYALAFTSYEGNYSGFHEMATPILTPPENSLESDLFIKKSEPILINLKIYPKEEFYTSAFGYLPILMKWKNVFDGIYYIPKMYPPEIISYRENIKKTLKAEDKRKITGKLLDEKTQNPIKYGNIYFKSSNRSVVTNDNGDFSITSPLSPDYMIVSAIGYKNDSVRITGQNKITISLKSSGEKISDIDELVLKNKKALSASEILEKARDNIEKNYIQTPYNQKFYVSTERYNDKNVLKYQEQALVELFNSGGMNSSNNAEKGIFGEILQYKNSSEIPVKQNWDTGIGNLWVQINRDIILSKANVLYRSNSYDLTTKKLIEYDGKKVYKIDFVNNSPGSYSTGYGYPAPESSKGTIYIENKTFAVVRYEHCIVRKVSQNKYMKYPVQSFHKIIETYKEINGKYFLNFYKQINKSNFLNEDKIVGSNYENFYLMSEDVKTNELTEYKRPLIKLKPDFEAKTDEKFWETSNFYIEDQNFRFENCSFED